MPATHHATHPYREHDKLPPYHIRRQDTVSDFDAQDALHKLDENRMPAGWTIYRVRENYFYEQGAPFALITVMLVGVTIAIDFAFPLSRIPAYWCLVAPLDLMFLAVSIYTGREAISQFSQVRTIGTRVFVLTPEGCVARVGPKPNQISSISYAQVAAIALSVQHSTYASTISLILTYSPGHIGSQRRVRWPIDPQFGASDAIAQAIIAAHTRYAVTHASAIAREAPPQN